MGLLVGCAQLRVVFCRRLEHKYLPELCSDPEDGTKLKQRNHDEVKEGRPIELASIETREIARAQCILSGDRSPAQGWNGPIGPGNREEK